MSDLIVKSIHVYLGVFMANFAFIAITSSIFLATMYELHTWQSQRCWRRLQRASFMSSSEVTSADSRPRLHLPTAAFTHKVKNKLNILAPYIRRR